MADRAFAAVRIAEEDHVAFFDGAGIGAQEAVDKAAKLAYQPLWTSVVLSISVTIAGPGMRLPAFNRARS